MEKHFPNQLHKFPILCVYIFIGQTVDLQPGLEVSMDVIALDTPNYKKLSWSTTYQNIFDNTAPHSENGQSAMILTLWNVCPKILFDCSGDTTVDFTDFVSKTREQSFVDSIESIFGKSEMYLYDENGKNKNNPKFCSKIDIETPSKSNF